MKKIARIAVSCLFILFSKISLATVVLENSYLQQIVNQLDAMKPLILAAEKAQPNNQRIQFHYRDLLEDVEKIKTGIHEKLNHPVIEPRAIAPIKGDYDDPKSQEKSS